MRKPDISKMIKSTLLQLLGICSALVGLKGFLLPNGFIDGGATGISLLMNHVTGFSFPLFFFLVNLPFIVLGYKQIGKVFAMKTFAAIIVLSTLLFLIEVPTMTTDKLLVAVFGGFFLGMGIGLSIRGGGVIDGTEVLALFISRRGGMTIGDIILVINAIIFLAAALLIDLETAFYSVLTYLSASKTIDFIIQGIEEYTGVTIVSEKSEEIRKAIVYTMGHGVTVFNGKRGFGNHGHRNGEIDVLFTVITRLEIARLRSVIDRIDQQAFVVMHSVNDTRGGMIKRRPLQEH